MLYSTIKRVRKYGERGAALCRETGNRCFGRVVYEIMSTGDLAIIINAPCGDLLVDLDTFLNAHRFFGMIEVSEK